MSTHYNYRDHRKILVIDGHTAFTGGVNLADEYINYKKKHGHWKDTAVMLQGQDIPVGAREAKEQPGYVMPYGDCPLDEERVGERVYMDILNRAHRYVHIMTPYLILDGEMETALKFAAERGETDSARHSGQARGICAGQIPLSFPAGLRGENL